MKKILLKVAITVCGLVAFASANAGVPISFAFQGGYTAPQFKQKGFEDVNYDAKLGIGGDFDVLYHLEQLDNKLGVGLTCQGALIFIGDFDDFSNTGFYGLSLYGAKGQWRFFNSKVSPYGALSFGLSRFATPDWKNDDGKIITKGKNAFGFGARPELGVEFGVFFLSAGYMIPMKYTFKETLGGKTYEDSYNVGSFQFNMGLRFSLFRR